MMWVLVVNGLVYLGLHLLCTASGAISCRAAAVVRDAWEMVRFYLTVRKDHPRQGKHNALQRLVVLLDADRRHRSAVVTGLAIWKPVQLASLTHLLGGYVWARYWHFLAMLLLVVLTFGHVFMVFAVDPVFDAWR